MSLLYKKQSRYAEAEPLYLRALQIHKKVLGDEHPEVATTAINVAALYDSLGEEHPDTVTYMFNQATCFMGQHRFAEAKVLLEEVLRIQKKTLGEGHYDVATSMRFLALASQRGE